MSSGASQPALTYDLKILALALELAQRLKLLMWQTLKCRLEALLEPFKIFKVNPLLSVSRRDFIPVW
jgi:hypothetical protein